MGYNILLIKIKLFRKDLLVKKLLKYLKPYTKECIISPLFKLLEAVFDLLVPIVVKTIIDDGIATSDKRVIFSCFGVLVAFAAVGLTCSLIAQYFAARTATGVSAKRPHSKILLCTNR